MLDEALSIFPLIKFNLTLKIIFIIITILCLISFCGILLIELDKIKENTNNFKKIFLVEFLKILTGVILGTIIGIYIIAIIFYF